MSATDGQPGLIKILTGVVVLTSGLVALSLLATNPEETNPSSLTAMARAPASLVGMALTPEFKAQPLLERTSTLEFSCRIPASAQVTADTRQVRISGKICDLDDVEATEVINLTNGFTATMFTPSPNQYTSDYIHLADGENHLRISMVKTNGERLTQDFAVLRPPTPSK